MIHLLMVLAAIEIPKGIVDAAALLSGFNDTTEFVTHHVVPAAIGGHGLFAIAKRVHHSKR